MSYELIFEFESIAARDDVVSRLRASSIVNYSGENAITLKDPRLNSIAPYDIGFSWENDSCVLDVDLLFKTDLIYLQLSNAIDSNLYKCTDECDESVTLEEVFRLP